MTEGTEDGDRKGGLCESLVVAAVTAVLPTDTSPGSKLMRKMRVFPCQQKLFVCTSFRLLLLLLLLLVSLS